MVRTFQGIKPTIPTSCFIEETGVVIGDVILGEHCSVWFHAVIRGDVHSIKIGNRTNVQDLCMLHVTHDIHPLIIGNEVTIGHGVILHGCTIRDRVLIGMGAIIMDGAVIGEDSVVGAGATAAEIAWIKESAENYVKYAGQYLDNSSKTKPGFQI